MNLETISNNIDSVKNHNLIQSDNIKFIQNRLLSFNGLVPLMVYEISRDFPEYTEIDLTNDSGNTVGWLYIPSKNSEVIDIDMTEVKFAAYLVDIDLIQFNSKEYKIKNPYVIIKEGFLHWYLTKRKTSPLWGGFSHIQARPPVKKVKSLINIPENIILPTASHYQSALSSIVEPYAFERFLKKYHLLELVSDWDIVQSLKNLGDDLYGIGPLLSSIDSNDLNKLRISLTNRITNVDSIVICLNALGLSNYETKSFEIFQKYKKPGNALSDVEFNTFFNLPGYDLATIYANNTFKKSATTSLQHRTLLIQILSYWIYRVRCSVAHQRIGEYIFSPDDESYVCDFMEPIIDVIIISSFRN